LAETGGGKNRGGHEYKSGEKISGHNNYSPLIGSFSRRPESLSPAVFA
jgi:hypothetical protein